MAVYSVLLHRPRVRHLHTVYTYHSRYAFTLSIFILQEKYFFHFEEKNLCFSGQVAVGNGAEVVMIEEKPEEATSSLDWASVEATKKKEVVEISGEI